MIYKKQFKTTELFCIPRSPVTLLPPSSAPLCMYLIGHKAESELMMSSVQLMGQSELSTVLITLLTSRDHQALPHGNWAYRHGYWCW